MNGKCGSDSPDSIKCALSIVGDKWTALILRGLHEGPMRFSDFEKNIEGINPRTLSQRLEKLAQANLITKSDNTYELTKAGEDLDAVIHQMALWGKKHAKTIL